MTTDFEISTDRDAHRARLRVTGLLDAYTGELLRTDVAELIEAGVTEVDLDASGITFIDSGGLRILADVASNLEHRGGVLVVVEPSETMAQILRITDLAGRFGL
jgi:anti-sigma B factor antagonist